MGPKRGTEKVLCNHSNSLSPACIIPRGDPTLLSGIYLSDVAQSQLPMHATSPHRKRGDCTFNVALMATILCPRERNFQFVPTDLWIKWLIKKNAFFFSLKILTVTSEFWILSYTINKLNVQVEWLSTLWGQMTIFNTRRRFNEQHHHQDSSVKKKNNKRKV